MVQEFSEKDISVSVSGEKECRKIISFEVAPEHLKSEKERVLKSYVRKVQLPGFRKGKAPVGIVRNRFAGEIESEALQNILPQAYGHAVTSQKLQPIGEPVFSDIKAEGDVPLTFRVEVEVYPEIKLSGYKGIKIEAETVDVTDEDVDEVLKKLQERNADFETVERPAVTSDMVILDYVPLGSGGEPDEDKRVSEYPVQLGTGQIFPVLEEAVIGKEAGAGGTVDIEYPGNYSPEHLAGTKLTYRFDVREVREKRIPPLDDEFVRKVDPELETVDGLMEDIRKRLLGEKRREARRKREEKAIDRLIERDPFEVPRSMIERYKKKLYEEDARRRQLMGAGPEEDEEKKKQMEEFFNRLALRSIKRYFLIDYIGDLEKIEISSGDVDGEIESNAAGNGRSIEDVKKVFAEGSEHLINLKRMLRERKIFEVILGSDEEA